MRITPTEASQLMLTYIKRVVEPEFNRLMKPKEVPEGQRDRRYGSRRSRSKYNRMIGQFMRIPDSCLSGYDSARDLSGLLIRAIEGEVGKFGRFVPAPGRFDCILNISDSTNLGPSTIAWKAEGNVAKKAFFNGG